jgi:hypothetical protein
MLGHERIDSTEPHEADRRHPMLSFDSGTDEVVPERSRHGTSNHGWVRVSFESQRGLDEHRSPPTQ